MLEKENQKEKEAELVAPIDPEYNEPTRRAQLSQQQAREGKKLIKGKEIPFRLSRMAITRKYSREWWGGLTNNNWTLFIHEVRTHSGKHRHQGGLTLFVLNGKGYTVVDGRRFDWGEGDLICLPIKKDGVEHQHFNTDDKPSRWFAFILNPYHTLIGHMYDMRANNPFWTEPVTTESKSEEGIRKL